MNIFFVRHGKDDDRYRGGWSQMDLLPEGVDQAKRLALYLKAHNDRFHISAILSSDLQRALTTAEAVAAELNLPVTPEPLLRETNNGDLAGLSNVEAETLYPGLYFSTLQMDECYPNGESPQQFFDRVKDWFDDFIFHHKNVPGNILVVTHGGVIGIIYHIVNHLTWNNQISLKVPNCGIYVLNTDKMELVFDSEFDAKKP